MSFGAASFGMLPFGAAGSSPSYAVQSLGYIVTFGTPLVAALDTSHDLESLGYIINFGDSFVGSGSVFRMSSLGVITRFGRVTTIGDVSGTMESLGYVVHFGKLYGIKFKRRSAL